MRIQETDRVLKESRYARNDARVHEHEHDGLFSRMWQRVVGMFKK